MNAQVSYRQRAAVWLKLLAPWWRLFGRGAAIKEVESILSAAQDDIQTAKNNLEAEYVHHLEINRKYLDVCRELGTEEAQHRTSQAQLRTVMSRLDLITSILGAANQEHPKYLAFRKLFREDFLRFANGVNLYEREAEAVFRLQAVEEELRLLGRVPLFREKKIVAVAGGFSSGKSSLISSFFGAKDKVNLPIAMEPVTAIPTYIAHSTKTEIVGFPAHGGTVEIVPELFSQMQHEFLKSLGFDLRRILPFIVLETPWCKPWDALCFIDTPGYNPAQSGGTIAADDATTAGAIRQADAILWVLGIDTNGEISSDDLAYLLDHGGGLPLVVVVNKADLRPLSQVREIVDQIRDTLDANLIQYLSINAYSSVEGREYEYVGQPLDEVLGSWNMPTRRDKRLRDEITSILDNYIETFTLEIEAYKAHKKELHSLRLDLDQLGLFDEATELPVGSKVGRSQFLASSENSEQNAVKETESTFLQKLSILFKKRSSSLTFDLDEQDQFDESEKSPVSGKKGGKKDLTVIEDGEQSEIKEMALKRLQNFSDLFTVEKLEAQKSEAKRLRNLMIHLFHESW